MKRKLIAIGLCLFGMLFAFSQEKIPFIDTEELISMANEVGQSGDYKEAIKHLEKINVNDSLSCSLITLKTYYYLNDGNYDKAIFLADEGLKNDFCTENRLYYLINKGVAYEQSDRLDDAIDLYSDALKQYPGNAQLWYNKGVILQKQEKVEEAISAFQKSILLNPLYTKPHHSLGNICYEQGRMAQALMSFNIRLLLNPEGEEAFQALSYINEIMSKNNTSKTNSNIQISDDEDDFSTIDLVLNNRFALQEDYKINHELTAPIIKQTHILIEQLKELPQNEEGFWSAIYLPFYQWISKNDHFDNFAYTIAYSATNETYRKILDSKTKDVSEFLEIALLKWQEILTENPYRAYENHKGKNYSYYSTYLEAVGELKNKQKIGLWNFYNEQGAISGKGSFSDNNERDGKWTWFHLNGKTKETALYKNGVLEGKNEGFFENGNLQYIAHYKNGELDGEFRFYNESGALLHKKYFSAGELEGPYTAYFSIGEAIPEFEMTYSKNKLQGEFTEYFANSNVYAQVKHEDGLKNGVEKRYNKNQSLNSETTYVNGVLSGSYKITNSNQTVIEEGQFEDGEYHGLIKRYYEDGTPESELSYNKGELHGLIKYFDEDGKIYSEYDYSRGNIIAYRFFDKSGNILKEDKKKGGEFYFEGYSPYGKLTSKGLYDSKGGKKGIWEFYTTPGLPSYKGNFVDNNPVGEYIEFYETGAKKAVSSYDDNGLLNGYYVAYHLNGKMEMQGWHLNDQQHGEWQFYYIDGTVESINYFHKDQLHGTQKYFSGDGQLNYTLTYKFGRLVSELHYDREGNVLNKIDYNTKSGEYVFNKKYRNGKTALQTTFVNDVKHGAITSYSYNGNTTLEGNYLVGLQHGKWTWYYEDGTPKFEGTYVLGELHGEVIDYYKNGEKEGISTYNYGQKIGTSITFHDNGIKSVQTHYKNGKMHGKREFYDTEGRLQLIRFYEYGRLVGYSYLDKNKQEIPMKKLPDQTGKITAYYDNGNISREMEFKNGQIVGIYKAYYYSGVLENEFKYEKGEYSGPYKNFYPDGKIKSETPYLYGEKHGLEKKYYENGQLKEETNYVNGYKEGDSKHYNESGKVIRITNYFFGDIYDEKVF